MKQTFRAGMILAVLSATGILTAFAAKPAKNDALITGDAKVSLAEAAQIAEQQVHGRAVRAELERSKKGWIYDVELVANGSSYDVAIDATKGSIVAAVADKTDSDDDHDQVD